MPSGFKNATTAASILISLAVAFTYKFKVLLVFGVFKGSLLQLLLTSVTAKARWKLLSFSPQRMLTDSSVLRANENAYKRSFSERMHKSSHLNFIHYIARLIFDAETIMPRYTCTNSAVLCYYNVRIHRMCFLTTHPRCKLQDSVR